MTLDVQWFIYALVDNGALSVEDAVAASLAFEELMGDQVEKRKAFIERKAGSVKNLDI